MAVTCKSESVVSLRRTRKQALKGLTQSPNGARLEEGGVQNIRTSWQQHINVGHERIIERSVVFQVLSRKRFTAKSRGQLLRIWLDADRGRIWLDAYCFAGHQAQIPSLMLSQVGPRI